MDERITPENERNAVYGAADSLQREIGKAIFGKERECSLLVMALIAGGHVLIEDVPGVGKTTLASALAKAAGLSFRRAQFTPDVMASDITGFNVYNRKTESFEFRRGLADTNILLADEINRASPKTQSSLLEAMEESAVTVDGVTYPLPDPFMVIATQNPLGYVGTYPLPEAQLDRFSLRIGMGYPSEEDEITMLRKKEKGNPAEAVTPVANDRAVRYLRGFAESITVSREIEKYIVSLVSATRNRRELALGASPRASVALMKLARAGALLKHRDYVVPEDVADIFGEAVAHRLMLTPEAAASGITAESVLDGILASVPVPFTVKNR